MTIRLPLPVDRAAAFRPSSTSPELAVIVPTYCEAGNIGPMLQALRAALHGVDFEVIFVDDDSPDGTIDLVRAAADCDQRVRGIRRIRRRGLAGAAFNAAKEVALDLFLDGRIGFMFGRPKIEHNKELNAGGLRIEVVEPFKHLRTVA